MILVNSEILSNTGKKVYRIFEQFSVPGVYAMINEKDQKIFISHSSNILSSGARVIFEINNKTHPNKELRRDRKRLKFILLDVEVNKTARLIKLEQWISYFKDAGYQLYNKSNHTPKYKVKWYILGKNCWVCLVNSRYKKFYVKKFIKVDEAKEFIKNHSVEDIVKIYMESQKSN